jgi:hypothetical protein
MLIEKKKMPGGWKKMVKTVMPRDCLSQLMVVSWVLLLYASNPLKECLVRFSLGRIVAFIFAMVL